VPFVFDKSIARCFCAKSSEAAIGRGRAFTRHKILKTAVSDRATGRTLY